MASIPFLNNIDLSGNLTILFGNVLDMSKNEIQNAVFQKTTEPTSPALGQFFYNNSTNKFGYWNGTMWVYPTTDGDADTLDGQHGSYYLNRSNHTGTQTHTTISDFDAGVQSNYLNSLTPPSADMNFNGKKLRDVADPVLPDDAATKNYVDVAIAGLAWKDSVKCATTANITLSALQTVDGVALLGGERVLVKNQTNSQDNGIYVAGSGAWTRSTDMDNWAEVPGAAAFIEQGTTNHDISFVCTADAGGTLGVTAITWAQFSGQGGYSAGSGLSLSGSTFNVNVDNQSIEIISDNVQAKLDPAGCIVKSASGMAVAIDDVTIIESGNSLTMGSAYKNKKVTGTITGNASATVFTITHNLNSKDFQFKVYEASTGFVCYPLCTHFDLNNAKVEFKVAPASGKIYYVVLV